MSEYKIVKMKRKPLYTTEDMARAAGLKVGSVRMQRSRGEIEPYDPDMRDALYTESELIKFAEKRKRRIEFTN